MKILITGIAGFIGTNCAINLLQSNHIVYGIDNFDNYNSVKLKKLRLKELHKYKNFKFNKVDIANRKKLLEYTKNKKIDHIIHLAAQAGVRYSTVNPKKYIEVNIFGFLNLLFASKKIGVKKIIYASSSSVYGESKKFPVSETNNLNQKNIYAVSKQLNEKIAETYSKFTKIKFIGLRFFTIYGEWGRPDMFLFKLFNASINKKNMELNNYGNHFRDFTHIKDVTRIIKILLNKNIKNHMIFNICSNNPINILEIVKNFKKNNDLKVKYVKKHKADIFKTHGNNKKIIKFTKHNNFFDFDKNLLKVFKWYKLNKIHKL